MYQFIRCGLVKEDKLAAKQHWLQQSIVPRLGKQRLSVAIGTGDSMMKAVRTIIAAGILSLKVVHFRDQLWWMEIQKLLTGKSSPEKHWSLLFQAYSYRLLALS